MSRPLLTAAATTAAMALALAAPAFAQQQTPPTTEQQGLVPADARDGIAGEPGEMAATAASTLVDCEEAEGTDAVMISPAEEAALTEDEDGVEIVAESDDVQIEAIGVEEMEEQAEALQETEALEEASDEVVVAATPC